MKRNFKERKDQWYKRLTDGLIVSSEILTGPRGGQWYIDYLNDGRVGLKGPWSQYPKPTMSIPLWVQKYVPEGQQIINAGGTAFRQRRYITEQKEDVRC